MHILLTNDDGILAPGLAAMYHELAKIGTVTVAAPASVQSAMGHAITIGEAIEVRRIHAHNEFFGWSVDGRPADCVKLAVSELVDTKIDLVVSGINDGANVAINILYSGTVAAAAEGALLGHRAVAVSLQRSQEMDFARASDIARRMIERLLEVDLAPGNLVNINIPNLKPELPKGVRVAAQAVQTVKDEYTRHELPGDVRQYGLYGEYTEPEGIYDTDLHALQKGYVVVTPLRFDLTDRDRMDSLSMLNWPDMT